MTSAEEPLKKKVKIQIGSQVSGDSSSSQHAQSQVANKITDFTGSLVDIALGDVCDSHFLLRKGRKNRVKLNVFAGTPANKASSAASLANSAAAAANADNKNNNNKPAPKPSTSSSSSSDQKPTEYGPRVEIINGQIVLKESSLTISNNDNTTIDDYVEVVEGAHATSRYSSFRNSKPARTWGIEETRLFYEALKQCGTDFSAMQNFFPTRTRKELKMKYKREENSNPLLVSSALESSVPLDLTPFEMQLGVKIEIPTANDNDASEEESKQEE